MRRKIPRSPLLQEKDVRLAFAEAPPHGGSEGRDGTQVQWAVPATTAKMTAGIFFIRTMEGIPIPMAQTPNATFNSFFKESGSL